MGSAHQLPVVAVGDATHAVVVGTDNEPKRVPIGDLGGGGGGASVPITQAAYDALDPPDPDTDYIITDAGPVYASGAQIAAWKLAGTLDPNRLYIDDDPPPGAPLNTTRGSHVWAHYPGFILPSGYSGLAQVANTLDYEPFLLEAPIVLNGLAVDVTTLAAGTTRLGIARLDNNYDAIDLVVDAGTVDVSTTGWKALTGLSVPLAPGLYAKLRISNVACSLARHQCGISPGYISRQFIRTLSATSQSAQHTAFSEPLPAATAGVDWDTAFFHSVYMTWS
jgi:hypothetical protein